MSDYAIIPSDPAAKKKIMDALGEISNAMFRIESEKSYIKESINMIAEEYEIKKPILAKLAKFHHKQSAQEEKAKTDEVFEAYVALTGEEIE